MSQKNVHFLRFLVYDPEAVGFWAVVSIANFHNDGDSENMTLSNIDGTTSRNKPKELLSHLDGLISILSQPTKETVRSAPKLLLKAT